MGNIGLKFDDKNEQFYFNYLQTLNIYLEFRISANNFIETTTNKLITSYIVSNENSSKLPDHRLKG